MSKQQMIRDIDKWSRDKLQQWFDDTMMRYRLIDDVNRAEAITHVMGTLMMATAGGFALQTSMPPQDAGIQFAKLVHLLRKHKNVSDEIELTIEVEDLTP